MKNFCLSIGDWDSNHDYQLLHDDPKSGEDFKRDVKESFTFVTQELIGKGNKYIGDIELSRGVLDRLKTFYGYYDIEYESHISLEIYGIVNDNYSKDLRKMIGKNLYDKIIIHNKKVDKELHSHLFIEDEGE